MCVYICSYEAPDELRDFLAHDNAPYYVAFDMPAPDGLAERVVAALESVGVVMATVFVHNRFHHILLVFMLGEQTWAALRFVHKRFAFSGTSAGPCARIG